MRKQLLHILIISFVFLVPNVARATEGYDFMSAIISSLQSAKIAQDRLSLNANEEDEVIMMKNIIVYNKELKEAASFVKPYTSSKSEMTKLTATTLCEIYSLIILNYEGILRILENVLSNIDDLATKQGTFLRELSEIGATNDVLLRKIPEVTALSLHALVDEKRSLEDRKVMFLKTSSDEIESLIDQLISAFGEDIKSELKAGIPSLDMSASLLYLFFDKKDYKPADAK